MSTDRIRIHIRIVRFAAASALALGLGVGTLGASPAHAGGGYWLVAEPADHSMVPDGLGQVGGIQAAEDGVPSV